jgi:uncharacterized iron-regulated membrane protein
MHRTRGELGKTTTTASFLPYWRSMHKWSMIVVALLVLVFAVAGQAKAEALFAAIWEQGGGPAFQARHNLTAAQYQQTFDQLVGQGFRPRAVSGYEVPAIRPSPPNFTCAVCKNGSCQCGSQTQSQLCTNHGG